MSFRKRQWKQLRKTGSDGAGGVRNERAPMRCAVMACALAMMLACVPGLKAQAQTFEEHEAKAAFVLKVVNFVQWPAEAGRTNLVIGVVGEGATGQALQRLSAGKSVNGQAVVVRRLNGDSDPKLCQVLFIDDSERKNATVLLERLRGASVLTVGESDGFGQRGGIINLLVQGARIRFEVNSHAAERARLQISSRLLALATLVNDGSPGGGQ